MSADEQSKINAEREELLTLIRGMRAFLHWVFGGILLGGAALTWLIMSDHFDQLSLRDEVDGIKPKVERLWWKNFPDASAVNRSTSATANL